MKKALILLTFWASTLGTCPASFGQTPLPPALDSLAPAPLRADTLPRITVKFEPVFLIPAAVLPALALFINFHSYKIDGVGYKSRNALQPYLLQVQNEQISFLYAQFEKNKKTGYALTGTGLVVLAIGMTQSINSLFDPSSGSSAGPLLLLASGLVVGGQVARSIGFRNLRQAISMYNFQYATTKPEMSLHLGWPSSSVGIALVARF